MACRLLDLPNKDLARLARAFHGLGSESSEFRGVTVSFRGHTEFGYPSMA